MFFNDPTSAHILRSADLVEARQARTPHRREPDQHQLPAGQRLLARVGWFRAGVSSGPLSESHELFVGHDRSQLIQLGRFFRMVDVPAGKNLGRQGHIAREFVTILRGEVGVTIDGSPHAVLDDGSHFGAVPLLSDTPDALHIASFTAMTPTRIAVATQDEFHSMLAEFPLVAQRVRALTDVRRAYLAGLAHANDASPVPSATDVRAYPVHLVQQRQHH